MRTVGRNVDLVVCAAPLARHVERIGAELVRDGWHVSVVPSVNATEWLSSGSDSLRGRMHDRSRPRADVTLAIPATFNTLNKLRAGISDTPALGALNDAVGTRTPLLVVPMVSERLIEHPAWTETVSWLTVLGVSIMDPADGRTDRLQPLSSGTGEQVAESFDGGAVVRWLAALPQR